jgi:lipid A ethanolaminephosphotransferase
MVLPPISRLSLTLITAACITLFANLELWKKLHELLLPLTLGEIPFVISAAVLVFAIAQGVCHIFAIARLQKFWLIVILVSSAAASYYQMHYHVLYDKTMIQNILGTDYREAYDLFNLPLVLWVSFFGVLPACVVAVWPVKTASIKSQVLSYVLGYLISIALLACVALAFYKDYASLFRNHRELKHYIIPSSFVYSLYGFALDKTKTGSEPVKVLGADAQLGAKWPGAKPVVFILVVGETARRANFSLAGYGKNTNPALAAEDIVFFDQATSCGTATAMSVPCMFAREPRKEFNLSRADYSENLLDVLQHAGLNVHWMDNNSGCKGVCQRVSYEQTPSHINNELCRDGECFDMALLEHLPERFATKTPGAVIVLHQKGSHGPSYFERSPEGFKPFLPECKSNQLQRCTSEEISNAYDNSIVYTDYILGQLINQLKANTQYATAMLYMSDHGESLGENGFYLHGFPYALAPKEQIDIPMIFWASEAYREQFGLDWACIKNKAHEPVSHDNLFSSVLSLLDIHTDVLDTALDFTAGCTTRATP